MERFGRITTKSAMAGQTGGVVWQSTCLLVAKYDRSTVVKLSVLGMCEHIYFDQGSEGTSPSVEFFKEKGR
jgi:hypothetical protein